MRDILFLLTYIFLVYFITRNPAVAALAYLVTDLAGIHQLAYGFIASTPVSMIFAIVAIFALFFVKNKPAIFTFGTKILILWCLWMTVSTFMAIVQDAAWYKWDSAFKVAAFSLIFPYFFNSRAEIESVILIILVSITTYIIPFSLKTVFSGGGYGANLGLIHNNSGLSEGSTFALIAVSIIPLFWWVGSHSILVRSLWIKNYFLKLASVLAIVATFGTFARTGLVALVALVTGSILLFKRKFRYLFWVTITLAILLIFFGNEWLGRMKTIKSASSDNSAAGRLAVWDWTIDYVMEHPLGGGFGIYKINNIDFVSGDGSLYNFSGIAFHSIYFEILGELGVPGFVMFISMVLWLLITLNLIRCKCRELPEFYWLEALTASLMVTIFVYLAGGAFVGIAFQPYFWYLYAVGISIVHYTRRNVELY